MKMPFMQKVKSDSDVNTTDIDNGHAKKDNSEYYTGNKSKKLTVHIVQKIGNELIEVDKPIHTKIYMQSIEWRGRKYPIVPSRFYYDYNGIAHQQVDVNDCAVLTWHKDHTDTCKKCGGKMTVDAREARMLGRRGIFSAIWGLDNTHMMLLLVFAIGAMAMAGAFFWAYTNDVRHTAELTSAKAEITRQNNVIAIYQNVTGITIGR